MALPLRVCLVGVGLVLVVAVPVLAGRLVPISTLDRIIGGRQPGQEVRLHSPLVPLLGELRRIF